MLHLPTVSFDTASVESSAQATFDQFYGTSLNLLDQFYPMKTVTITSRDPEHLTPDIKAKLRRKNKLMRSGRIEEAGALARQIGVIIARRNSSILAKITASTNAKTLWSSVKKYTNRAPCATGSTGFLAADLNKYHAAISTESAYVAPQLKQTAAGREETFREFQILKYLDKLHITATGLDKLPAWFLRLGAPMFARPICNLFIE